MLEISSLLSKRTELYIMKRWLMLLFWGTLTVDAQNVTVSTDTPLPTLPLRFSTSRRFEARYIDSVVTHTRRHLLKLEALPRSHQVDTLRLELLIHLSYAYQFAPGRQDSVQLVARQLIQLARQWGDARFQVRGYIQEDYYYTLKENYPQALQTNHELLRLVESNPPLTDQYLWRIQKNLGKLSYRMGKYEESIQFYRTASANLLRDKKARLAVEQINVLQLMSESFKLSQQLDSAETCSVRALALARQLESPNITMAYLHGDLAVVYLHQHRYEESLNQLQLAEERWQKVGRRNGLAVTWADMAHIYYLTSRYTQALAYASQALTYDSGIPSTRLLIYEVIALASAAQHDWQTAFRFHQRYKAMADSIQTQRKLTETLSLQANFEREKLIMGQQQAQQLQEQRYLTLAKEKELQEQHYLTLEKEAELKQFQAIADQQRLLQITRQTDLQRQLETQTIKAQAQTRHNQQQNQIRTLQLKELQTQLTLQENTRNFWVILTGLIGISLLGYTQLLRQKNKALRLANDDIKTAMQHGQTQEMAALRAQMNPHFVFNCINSIKLYTLQNDTDRASDYLTKFARLIRLVLENSRADRVTLQHEIEALQLYCDLEAMRFKQKVTIHISIDADIDQQFATVPPLLLQPYVENAIWHGLMHKLEGGTVMVAVTQPTDTGLHVEIIDDGVGRARAAELKSKSAGNHKSFGMQVTADRIRMINALNTTKTNVQIFDLIAPNGDSLGTKVVLDIPV